MFWSVYLDNTQLLNVSLTNPECLFNKDAGQFLCKFCTIFKNTYFEEHPGTAASEYV